jgi:hypothetical protein
MASQMLNCRPWGDWMVQMDEDRNERIVRMTDAEWKECAKQVITNNRGRGDLRPVLNWLDAMDAKRTEFKAKTAAPVIVRDMSPAAVMFRVWKDMILEPAKYGDDDWEEWLLMDRELTSGPGRWRVAAFWLELEAEQKAQLLEVYATRIQAAWRGHCTRDSTPGLNCEGCLAHKPSPKQFNGMHLCKGCVQDQHNYTFASKFLTRVVPRAHLPPVPREEPDEHGRVPCDGCGRVVCYEGDYGDYRPGWWCSRACAYDL